MLSRRWEVSRKSLTLPLATRLSTTEVPLGGTVGVGRGVPVGVGVGTTVGVGATVGVGVAEGVADGVGVNVGVGVGGGGVRHTWRFLIAQWLYPSPPNMSLLTLIPIGIVLQPKPAWCLFHDVPASDAVNEVLSPFPLIAVTMTLP
jgi:hypothetical protein